jgi:hypothetical protein
MQKGNTLLFPDLFLGVSIFLDVSGLPFSLLLRLGFQELIDRVNLSLFPGPKRCIDPPQIQRYGSSLMSGVC